MANEIEAMFELSNENGTMTIGAILDVKAEEKRLEIDEAPLWELLQDLGFNGIEEHHIKNVDFDTDFELYLMIGDDDFNVTVKFCTDDDVWNGTWEGTLLGAIAEFMKQLFLDYENGEPLQLVHILDDDELASQMANMLTRKTKWVPEVAATGT